MAFAYASSWQALFAQITDRTYGVALSSKDAYQCLISVQIAAQNVLQGVWDSPSYSGAGWDVAAWDDQNFAKWLDITSLVRGIEWDAGAQDPIQEPEVGTALMTLVNLDGALSPWATSGTYTNPVNSQPIWDVTAWDKEVPASGASIVRGGTPVRFGVNYIDPVSGAQVYKPFFTGTIEAVEEATGDGTDAWVTLTLVDVNATLAAIGMRSGSGPATLAGTLVDGLTGDLLLAQLLNDVNFPYAVDTFVPPAGLTSLWNTAPFVVPDKATNVLAACQLLAESAFCRLHATPDGKLRAVDQRTRTGFAVTFANNPVAGELPIARDAIVPYSSTDRLLNIATGTSTTGRPQTATDAVSVGQFGPCANALGWPKTGLLLQNDTDVLTLVTDVVNASSNDFQGIKQIDIDCDLDPVNMYGYMSQLANAGIVSGWEFQVRWLHPSGSVLTLYVQLLGFHFNLTMEGKQAKWTGTLRTAKA